MLVERSISGKKAFITAIISDGKRKVDQPAIAQKVSGWDYILFTNVRTLLEEEKNWVPRKMDLINNSAVYTAKYCKWMAHTMIPEYDTVVWVDGYLSPNPAMNWDLFDADLKIGLKPHPSKSECVYKELRAVVDYQKDSRRRMKRLKKFLHKERMPADYGLYETNIYGRTLKDSRLNQILEKMYELMEEFTYRDQVILPYVLWKNNIRPKIFLSNEWALHSGIKGDHEYVKSFFLRIKNRFIYQE